MTEIKSIVFSLILITFFTSGISAQSPDTVCYNSDIFCDSTSMVGPWELVNYEISRYSEFALCNSNQPGSPQNTLFFAFVPDTNVVEIEIIPEIIIANTDERGYQYGIIDRCPTDFSPSGFDGEYIDCDASKDIVGNRIVGSNNFIPGHTYYLYIDGYGNSYVKFRLRAIQGIDSRKVDDVKEFRLIGPDTISCKVGDTISTCYGGKYAIEALNVLNAEIFEWKTQDTLEKSDSFKLKYNFSNESHLYKICTQAFTDCAISNKGCFYVKTDTLETMVLDTASVCSSALYTVGYIPPGWHGSILKQPGTFYYQYADKYGCKVLEQVTIIEGDEPIYQADDSLVCGEFPLKNDTLIRKMLKTYYGCDSIVDQKLFYFNFEGSIKQLECSNDSLLLKIEAINFDPSLYSKIEVIWYDKDLAPIKLNNSIKPFLVKKAGEYSAEVKLYKKNGSVVCSYPLDKIIIENIPTADIEISSSEICSSDTVFFNIKNFIDTLNYNVDINGGSISDLGDGKYYVVWDKKSEGNYELKINTQFGGCPIESLTNILVSPELNNPEIECIDNSNSSVTFGWIGSDCASKYEVWIDGVLKSTMTDTFITIEALTYGQSIDIEIKAISDCVCESKSALGSCSTVDCPDIEIELMNVPNKICYDQLESTYSLGYKLDTTAVIEWKGDICDANGIITKKDISDGTYLVSIEYQIGDCKYQKDSTIIIYPQVDANWTIDDLSCYDSEDGQILITPMNGTPQYNLNINNEAMDSLHVLNLLDGNYDIHLIDANGCFYDEAVSILRPDEPQIEIIGDKKVIFNKEFKYYLDNDGYVPDSVVWYYKENNSVICSGNCDTVKIVPNSDYELCITMFYDSICAKNTCLDVKIDRDFDIYVPNIFTPDFGSDKLNSNFYISSTNGLSLNIKTFKVFNRWGELLFDKANFVIDPSHPFAGWNGIYKGKVAPSGVYVYYIEVTNDDGEISKFYGDVTLIR